MDEFFSGTISKDFFSLFCGEKLGSGCGRDVYASNLSDDVVIKLETNTRSFQNIMEYETWNVVKGTVHAKWFAPCIKISPCGIVLLQMRTKPAGNDKYPAKIPSYFTDTKYANFGFIGKQLKCHDYGYHLLMEKGLNNRLVKAKWWDE